LSITAKIFVALFFAYSLPLASISKASLSIEAKPTVNPDMRPPNKINRIEMHMATILSFVVSDEANYNFLPV
jgi:hypothetical protein